jgi:hypothetical protein
MRVVSTVARRPAPEPPPTHRVHEVAVRLHHHVYELAEWAYRYEQNDPILRREGRTFAEFLADSLEGGLELPVTRWHRDTA